MQNTQPSEESPINIRALRAVLLRSAEGVDFDRVVGNEMPTDFWDLMAAELAVLEGTSNRSPDTPPPTMHYVSYEAFVRRAYGVRLPTYEEAIQEGNRDDPPTYSEQSNQNSTSSSTASRARMSASSSIASRARMSTSSSIAPRVRTSTPAQSSEQARASQEDDVSRS